MRTDAHTHFWRYRPEAYPWIGPGMEALAHDFLPPDLEPLLEETGIDATVAVTVRHTDSETEWLLGLAEIYPFIKGIVGWVDLRSPNLRRRLERLAPSRKLRGVRHPIQDEADPQFMLQPDFLRGIGMLHGFNLTYDVLVLPQHLPAAVELARKHPDQRFVLDNIARPPIAEGVLEPWDTGLQQLAELPNVFCKVSGLVTQANWQRWRREDFRPYLDVVFGAFGPGRTMIGSAWPVCTLAGSYADVMGVVFDYVSQFPPGDRAAILGDNAARFYQLGEL